MIQNDQLSLVMRQEIDKAVQALRRGLVILYPTDTIWGLGCDITNKSAVERVFEIKERPTNKPLIILVDSVSMLKQCIGSIHPRIETLLVVHDQPLTIIYPANEALPSYLTSEEHTGCHQGTR